MMNERAIRIIHFLYKTSGYLTADEIANLLGVSKKSVVLALPLSKEIVEKNGGKLFSKKGKGYLLEIQDNEKFELFFLPVFAKQTIVRHSTYNSFERAISIARLLVSQTKPITVNDIANQLFVTKSVINLDLKVAYRVLNNYSLSLISAQNKGLLLQGSEKHIRLCICDLNGADYNFDIVEDFNNDYGKWISCSKADAHVILNTLMEVMNNYCFDISHKHRRKISMYLAVMRNRLNAGCSIEVSQKEKQVQTIEMQTAKKLLVLLDERLGKCNWNEDEQYVISELIRCYHEDNDFDDLISQTEELFSELQANFSYLQKEGHLKHCLKQITHRVLLRKKLKIFEPMLFMNTKADSLIFHSPLSFHIACQIANAIEQQIHFYLSADEIRRIMLLIYDSIEQERLPFKKIKMVTSTLEGQGSSKVLMRNWNRYFHHYIESNEVVDQSKLTEIRAEDVDCALLSFYPHTYHGEIHLFFTDIVFYHKDIYRFAREVITQCYNISHYLPDSTTLHLNKIKKYKNEQDFIESLALRHGKNECCIEKLKEQLTHDYCLRMLTSSDELLILFGDSKYTDSSIIEISKFSHPVKWYGHETKAVMFISWIFNNATQMKVWEMLIRQFSGNSKLRQKLIESDDLLNVFQCSFDEVLEEEISKICIQAE